MHHGSAAFYTTVATVLPIFGFLAIYQRGHLVNQYIAVHEEMRRRRPGRTPGAARRYRLVLFFQRSTLYVSVPFVFIILLIGEVYSLRAMGAGTYDADTYSSVWQIIWTVLAWAVYVELLGLSARLHARSEGIDQPTGKQSTRPPIGARPAATPSRRRHARQPSVAPRNRS